MNVFTNKEIEELICDKLDFPASYALVLKSYYSIYGACWKSKNPEKEKIYLTALAQLISALSNRSVGALTNIDARQVTKMLGALPEPYLKCSQITSGAHIFRNCIMRICYAKYKNAGLSHVNVNSLQSQFAQSEGYAMFETRLASLDRIPTKQVLMTADLLRLAPPVCTLMGGIKSKTNFVVAATTICLGMARFIGGNLWACSVASSTSSIMLCMEMMYEMAGGNPRSSRAYWETDIPQRIKSIKLRENEASCNTRKRKRLETKQDEVEINNAARVEDSREDESGLNVAVENEAASSLLTKDELANLLCELFLPPESEAQEDLIDKIWKADAHSIEIPPFQIQTSASELAAGIPVNISVGISFGHGEPPAIAFKTTLEATIKSEAEQTIHLCPTQPPIKINPESLFSAMD